jgi:hypothetical protein
MIVDIDEKKNKSVQAEGEETGPEVKLTPLFSSSSPPLQQVQRPQ